ncbi:putative oxidoreductase [Serinicoccus hydrothermalis]|uniref:Putative oxidoreductase n=1 Tax=Serinicoccus hydrothermalis TaxID=1758689 RepID=A0A1B1N9Q6_9MICO|nr:aldo/keto reductase [Serinicoccus hydrothermalis]ANS78141.1 putative oxidoreductase [Serinicoccus hydrothermalis]
MSTPTFPGTDRTFAPINLGGNPFGWTADADASFAVLDAFLAAGGSFVDTADAYSAWAEGHEGGESEDIIGRWMEDRGNRNQVLVATKVGKKPGREGLGRDSVLAALDESLARLRTDHLDLYYAHADDEDVDIADQVATFDEVVRSGKVRAVGLSNYSPDRLRAFLETAKDQGATVPTAIQPRYSLVSRADYERDLAPLVADFDLAVFCYPALASGFLTGKYRTEEDFAGNARGGAARRYAEAGGLAVVDVLVDVAGRHDVQPASVALAWLLAKGVTAPIASASRPEQLEPLMAAVTLRLTEDEVAELDEASSGF